MRVTAGDQDAVIRTRVIVMPDSPDFCSLNAINRGVTKTLGPNGAVANYTLEWRPIGVDAGFLCTVRGSGVTEKCNLVIATCSQVDPAMWGLKAHTVSSNYVTTHIRIPFPFLLEGGALYTLVLVFMRHPSQQQVMVPPTRGRAHDHTGTEFPLQPHSTEARQ